MYGKRADSQISSSSKKGMVNSMTDNKEMLSVEEPVEETPVDEAVSEDVIKTSVYEKAEEEEQPEEYTEPLFDEGFLGTCERALYKAWRWVKKVLHIPDMSKKQKAIVWDKITTGILIALFATPFAVLLYILIWFLTR